MLAEPWVTFLRLVTKLAMEERFRTPKKPRHLDEKTVLHPHFIDIIYIVSLTVSKQDYIHCLPLLLSQISCDTGVSLRIKWLTTTMTDTTHIFVFKLPQGCIVNRFSAISIDCNWSWGYMSHLSIFFSFFLTILQLPFSLSLRHLIHVKENFIIKFDSTEEGMFAKVMHLPTFSIQLQDV